MKQRKGNTLIMVVITMVVLSIMMIIVANIMHTGVAQTTQVSRQNQARYEALSGSQVALGALFKRSVPNQEPDNALYLHLKGLATSGRVPTSPITSDVKLPDGTTAKVTISAKYNGARVQDNFWVIVESAVPLSGTSQSIVHEVQINLLNPASRTERSYTR